MSMTSILAKNIINWGLFLCFPSVVFCQIKNDMLPWERELLEYYHNADDQEKFKAACFLIEFMSGHHSPTGKALQEYVTIVNRCEIPCSPDSLSYYWRKSIRRKGNGISYLDDTLLLNKDFLISHIEQSFQVWRNSPWYKDVSFEEFCHYILPYRVSDEVINYQGRESLTAKYADLIQGETDIVKAFTIICSALFKRIRQTNPQCPYIPDAHTIDYLQQGNCLQRCVLLTEILRGLGIPCTIDIVPVWANYSQVGHSWVAMPYKGKNYTWRERDSIARTNNPIDASYFPVTYSPSVEDSYHYPVESVKKAAKVYRLCYEKDKNWKTFQTIPTLFTQRVKDVSSIYDLKDSITLTVSSSDIKSHYLCTFRSGKGWTPIAHTVSSDSNVTFRDVKKGIIYIIATYERGLINPTSAPFLLEENGRPRFFIANVHEKTKCRICRKYPVFSQWTNQWGNMIGGIFEGSHKPDFSDADTLAIIERMPFGETTIPVYTSNIYRYVRYRSTRKSRTPLAELSFYSMDKKRLKGTPISHKALQKSKDRVFDGDLTTEGYTKQTNYWVGLDLGDSIQTAISFIRFFPKNDENFVTRGKFYELFYYENGWHSLGERFSIDNYVEYEVPEGALFWLKCDIGDEERIFEYKKGRQVWY